MSSIEKWQDLVNSGRYIHPETAKNMPTTPPLEDQEEPNKKPTLPGRNWTNIGVTVATVILLLLFGFFSWKMIRQKPTTFVQPPPPVTQLPPQTDQTNYFPDIDYIIERVIERIKPLIPKERVIIRDYGPQQNAAIEQVRAWERVQRELMANHFKQNLEPGEERRLCMTIGNEVKCNTVKSDAGPALRTK